MRHDYKSSQPFDKYGVPAVSYPTPNLDDLIIVEDVPIRTQNYAPVEYGTPHPKAAAALLVWQGPVKGNDTDKAVRRVYATSREGQDAYNYAMRWVSESNDHPIYIRSYVVKREDYEPLPAYSPDPLNEAALLVKEEMNPVGDAQLDSLFVRVTRVYETLPGPEVTSRYVNERGDVETLVEQNVRPSVSPDSDGLLVTETRVTAEDTRKAKRRLATVASHSTLTSVEFDEQGEKVTLTDNIIAPGTGISDSLLTVTDSIKSISATKARRVRGTVASRPEIESKAVNERGDTETTLEQLVAAGTVPDADGLLVMASRVEGISKTKSRKRVSRVESHAVLTSLSVNQRGDLETETDAIVAAGTSPDADGVTVIDSGVKAISATKSRKRKVSVSSHSTLTSQQYNERGDLETETDAIVAAGTAPDSDGLLVMASAVKAISATKAKKVLGSVAAHAELVTKEHSEAAAGALVETHETIVIPSTSLPSESDIILDAKLIPMTRTKSKLRVAFISDGSGGYGTQAKLIDQTRDPELQSIITTERQVVPASTELGAAVIGELDEVRSINKWRSLYVKRTFDVPGTRTFYRQGAYRYPGILTNALGAIFTDPDDGRTILTVNYELRPSFSALATFKIVDEYFASDPGEPAEAFTPITSDYVYHGMKFSVNVSDVLCDGGFYLQYTDSAIVETYNFYASETTATAYLALVGVWTPISVESTIWTAGIYRVRTVSVKMR